MSVTGLVSGAWQFFLKLLPLSFVNKNALAFARRPTSEGSERKYPVAQRGRLH